MINRAINFFRFSLFIYLLLLFIKKITNQKVISKKIRIFANTKNE